MTRDDLILIVAAFLLLLACVVTNAYGQSDYGETSGVGEWAFDAPAIVVTQEMCESALYVNASTTSWLHSRIPIWANDHCDNRETWEHFTGGMWVEVTEEEYMQATCENVEEWAGGKLVKLYPKPEWAHCETRP